MCGTTIVQNEAWHVPYERDNPAWYVILVKRPLPCPTTAMTETKPESAQRLSEKQHFLEHASSHPSAFKQ